MRFLSCQISTSWWIFLHDLITNCYKSPWRGWMFHALSPCCVTSRASLWQGRSETRTQALTLQHSTHATSPSTPCTHHHLKNMHFWSLASKQNGALTSGHAETFLATTKTLAVAAPVHERSMTDWGSNIDPRLSAFVSLPSPYTLYATVQRARVVALTNISADPNNEYHRGFMRCFHNLIDIITRILNLQSEI